MSAASKRWLSRILPLTGVAAGLLLWWFATRGESVLASSFSPAETFKALAQLIRTGEIWPHFNASVLRVAQGLGLAALIGIPLGIIQGMNPNLERATSILFQFIRMISPLAWMPIAVMLLGVGDAPVLFLLTVAAVWPLLLGTVAGVHAVDRDHLTLARSLCASPLEVVTRVVVPSIIPHLLTGLRLAMGVIWIVLVPAEMLGVRAGLGYFILDTRDRLAYSELLAALLIIGAIGYAFDASLRYAHRRWAHPKH